MAQPMAQKFTAETLFDQYFAEHYPPSARSDLAKVRTVDANPSKNPSIIAKFAETAAVFAEMAPVVLHAPDLRLDGSDASVHRLAAQLTRVRRDEWLGVRPDQSPLVNMVIHGAVYVGECIVRNHGGQWLARTPLWESLVQLTSAAGVGELPIFHWWLKALSDEEIDSPRLADRYRTHVEVPTFDAEALPCWASPRRIPRLLKVRYDALHKHLRTHIPELRGVGDDFPSPERLDELRFSWLDFIQLGGGRMLLAWGPTKQGLHLFWLNRDGFVKAAFYPADPFPEPIVEGGDTLRVILSFGGKTIAHEVLWWGP